MRYVKWIFVVLLISSLTSFIEKDKKPAEGLSEGDVAPNFKIPTSNKNAAFQLQNLKGKPVLLSFWATYDAPSRMQNIRFSRALHDSPKVELVSIAFDEYASIFKETIRKDQIVTPNCFVETGGEKSELFDEYELTRGFANYLLDGNGVIIAKNISVEELSAYLKKLG